MSTPMSGTAAVRGFKQPPGVAVSAYLLSRRKRMFDIVLSFVGMAVTAVMFLPVALAIRLTSSGPAVFKQTRLGLDGRHFTVYKFRTMRQDAEANGEAQWASANDPRVTSVGRVLRKLYIDEFPQWWNVLKGDMSVVGPRPERPELATKIEEQVPDFPLRTLARPGITGWAQVNAGYVNSLAGSASKLERDVEYLRLSSFSFDLVIVLRTIVRLLKRKGY